MKRIAISLFALSLLAAGSYSAPVNAATQHQDALLRFVSKDSTLIGVSFGLSAVDGQVLLFDQRSSTHVASGLRTISYTCLDESQMAGSSRVTFDFVPGQKYELVCRSGQSALIRPAEEC